MMEKYTVKQLATQAGVSGRTLRYYDKIGLLEPSFINKHGYRFYEGREIVRLKQILFFKELEFSLEEIKSMMSSQQYDVIQVLKDQKKLMIRERERVESIITGIDKTIQGMKSKKNTDDTEFFGGLSKEKVEEYKKEVKQKYGYTSAYKQSAERTKKWGAKEYDAINDDMKAVVLEISARMQLGYRDDEVQRLIGKYKRVLEKFYDVTPEIFRGLADMYVADERFAAFFNKFDPKLAEFMKKAIYSYCDNQE